MLKDADISQQLISQVEQAYSTATPLCIKGAGSKDFYGRTLSGVPLSVSPHCGILSYQPSELVLTARAGTPLNSIQAELDKHQQMLAFEPPIFTESSTLGGTIACGFSGPRRAFAGAARDFVLGVTLINGKAERIHFGGQVIKNVAGYDVSRLMSGALGTLGLLLDISIKVLPKPEAEITLIQELHCNAAIKRMVHLKRQALPLSAAVYYGSKMLLRLSGSESDITRARKKLGSDSNNFTEFSWSDINNHTDSFFNQASPLWRLSVKPDTPALDIAGTWLYDWAGAQRWLVSDQQAASIFNHVAALGGHATVFRHGQRDKDIFQPLAPALLQLHENLKHAFDPALILNRGRLYPQF